MTITLHHHPYSSNAQKAQLMLDVVGADVVCLMPTKDLPSQQTAMVAGHIASEQVALIADRLVNG